MDSISALPGVPGAASSEQAELARLKDVSMQLEASFLTVMLDNAGVGRPPEAFGGGVGEDQFGSFLTQEYAIGMSQRGGVGLAEQIFEQLKERM